MKSKINNNPQIMACLNVESVNEKIGCIENLEEDALNKEAGRIEKDLKAYILNNFSVDKFQSRQLDLISDEQYKEQGKAIADAFRERNIINAEKGRKKKCPKITITVSLEW